MDPSGLPRRTAAVVALKPFTYAKSRLGTLPAPLRRRLAWCLAYDTLGALAGAVDQVAVVSDQPALAVRLRPLGPGLVVVPEGRPRGINAALSHGAARLRATGARTVLASVGDLPCLRASSVHTVLAAAADRPRAFLADASGVGTTMLIANDSDLEPHFQGRSAAAHRVSGAVALDDDAVGPVPDARRDVDTEVDLIDAQRLGLGPATAALFGPDGRLGRYLPITVTAERTGDEYSVITADGFRARLEIGALGQPWRELRLGQRLHATLAGDRVLSAWL